MGAGAPRAWPRLLPGGLEGADQGLGTPEVDCKPGSVPAPGCPGAGEDHSSRRRVATPLERSHPGAGEPHRERWRRLRTGRPDQRLYSSLLREGLAPPPVTRLSRVGSYPTISPLPEPPPHSPLEFPRDRRPSAVWFLWRFPSGLPGSGLPTSLPCGARTFLPRTVCVRRRSSVHLRHRQRRRQPVRQQFFKYLLNTHRKCVRY